MARLVALQSAGQSGIWCGTYLFSSLYTTTYAYSARSLLLKVVFSFFEKDVAGTKNSRSYASIAQ